MNTLTLVLPYPPSDNERYIGRTKKLSPVVEAYRRTVQSVVLEKRVPKITCDVTASVLLFPANERRDSSNCLKVLWDTLESVGVLKNDRQVKSPLVYRGEPHPSDMVCVRFTAWDGCVPDKLEDIATRKSTFISTNDLASIRAKVPAFDKTVFRKRKEKL